ncbi:MAG: NAD(P)H-hydrate dehydratase [Gammaproteobacteria bacterium]
MTPLYNIAAVREAESAALARRAHAPFSLMRMAGLAVADAARKMITKKKPTALILAGPGNNGGDALVAAAALQKHHWRVDAVLCQKPAQPDALRALRLWKESGGKTITAESLTSGDLDIAKYDIIIDGIFGIGGKRPLSGKYAKVAKAANTAAAKVLAIDIPSGINADTGGGGECIMATQTITFFANKPGLHTGKGAAASGEVITCTLGEKMTSAPDGMMINAIGDINFSHLRRQKDGHKGDYGNICFIGGDDGMTGALALAARACIRLGGGKVRAAPLCQNPPAFDTAAPEVMWQKPPVTAKQYSVIAIGTGLGKSAAAKKSMTQMTISAAASSIPIVADADGLNILAADDKLRQKFAARPGAKVITPHPAEAARLLKCTTTKVQNNRIAAAIALAKQTNAQTALKGAGTIMASPNGEWQLCGGGNPGLAQGGSGDILTGMIAALLAQTKDAAFAMRAGCYLHAAAADQMAKEGGGYIGMDINAIAAAAATIINRAL